MLGLLAAAPGVASVFNVGSAVFGAILRCTVCMIAIAIAAAFIAGDIRGKHKAEGVCQADKLRAELATKNADIENARRAAADATLRASAIQVDVDAANKRADDYAEELKKRPVPSCGLTDADLRRLRPASRGGR